MQHNNYFYIKFIFHNKSLGSDTGRAMGAEDPHFKYIQLPNMHNVRAKKAFFALTVP